MSRSEYFTEASSARDFKNPHRRDDGYMKQVTAPFIRLWGTIHDQYETSAPMETYTLHKTTI